MSSSFILSVDGILPRLFNVYPFLIFPYSIIHAIQMTSLAQFLFIHSFCTTFPQVNAFLPHSSWFLIRDRLITLFSSYSSAI